MKYYSTNKKTTDVSLQEAVTTGLAADGGLFMPETIPTLPASFFSKIKDMSLHEIAFEVAKPLLAGDIENSKLQQIIEETLSFDIPLVQVGESTFSLELFHGPTMAFKDVGARFMARAMSYFNDSSSPLTVLVATSGDTGSAVASGFFNVPGINVVILYPKGKVSHIQEQQLTTWGANITAVEIDGVFDDCQALVKQAFNDADLRKKRRLTSANSINIARLAPQMFYYFWAYAQLKTEKPVVFSVPSGNFGNLTAGLMAKRMGLPVTFAAATNANDTVPEYLATGKYTPKPSVQTISNAMDVGAPSNIARIQDMYGNDVEKLKKDIWTISVSDERTRETMKQVYKKNNYILDPHGAVSYRGLELYRKEMNSDTVGIFLETAHPAKFKDIVDETLGIDIEVPEKLKAFLSKKKAATEIGNNYNEIKAILSS